MTGRSRGEARTDAHADDETRRALTGNNALISSGESEIIYISFFGKVFDVTWVQ